MHEVHTKRTLYALLVAAAFCVALCFVPCVAHADDVVQDSDESSVAAELGDAPSTGGETQDDVAPAGDAQGENGDGILDSGNAGTVPEAIESSVQGTDGGNGAEGGADNGDGYAESDEGAASILQDAPQEGAQVDNSQPEAIASEPTSEQVGDGTSEANALQADEAVADDNAQKVEPAADPQLSAMAEQTPAKATTTSKASTATTKASSTAKKALTSKGATNKAAKASISYRTHVSNVGWLEYVSAGKTAGDIKGDQQLEALNVNISGVSGSIKYQVLVTGKGWLKSSNGGQAGTTGEARAIQALRAVLSGNAKNLYDVYYRVYVDDLGWLGWTKNNEKAGTEGFDRPLEGVQFKLVEKDAAKPSNSGSKTDVAYVGKPKVSVRVHVQNIGDQKAVGNGKIAGTSGKALRLEGIWISIKNPNIKGGAHYRVHIQNIGDRQGWKNDGQMAGTSGKALRLEALYLNLTNDMAKCYDLYYRVHVQNYGWMNWSTASEIAGTTGKALRLEAVQVRVTLKGGSASDFSYIYLDAGHGWGDGRYDSGAVGSGYREADQTKELVGKIAYYARNNYGLNVYNNSGCKINYTGRQNDAVNRGCTSFVSIHFNAGGGSGSESYAYTAQGIQLQQIMHPYLIRGTGLRDRGAMTYQPFSVIKGPVPATLLEICFIDTASDMRQYKARENEVAKQIAKGLYEASKRGF